LSKFRKIREFKCLSRVAVYVTVTKKGTLVNRQRENWQIFRLKFQCILYYCLTTP